MTGAQKHFAVQCAKALHSMDGDQAVFIVIATVCRFQEKRLRRLLTTFYEKMEDNPGRWKSNSPWYVAETSKKADHFQLLAEKIEAWQQAENVEEGPWSAANWAMFSHLVGYAWV